MRRGIRLDLGLPVRLDGNVSRLSRGLCAELQAAMRLLDLFSVLLVFLDLLLPIRLGVVLLLRLLERRLGRMRVSWWWHEMHRQASSHGRFLLSYDGVPTS